MERATKFDNEKYCSNCGQIIDTRAEICPKCGVRQQIIRPLMDNESVSDKEWLVTLLLAIFAGAFGVHRFYTGNITTGIIQLITLGGCGIWSLIDIIMIALGKFKDGEGRIVMNK